MSRFSKLVPALVLAAGLLPMAAIAGPFGGRAQSTVTTPATATGLSQGHFAANDPLAGQRQTGYSTQTGAATRLVQVNGGLSQGHLSNSDPLSGERQQGPDNTAG